MTITQVNFERKVLPVPVRREHTVEPEVVGFPDGELKKAVDALNAIEEHVHQIDPNADPYIVDEAVGAYVTDAEEKMPDGAPEEIIVAETAGLRIIKDPNNSNRTAIALDGVPISSLGPALTAIEGGKGPDATALVMATLDRVAHDESPAENSKPYGEFVGLTDDEVVETKEFRERWLDPRNNTVVRRVTAEEVRETDLLGTNEPEKDFLDRKFGMNSREALKEMANDTLDRIVLPMSSRSGTEVRIEGDEELRRPIMDITVDTETAAGIGLELGRRKQGMQEAKSMLRELIADESLDRRAIEERFYSILDRSGGPLVCSGVFARQYGEKAVGLKARGEVADLYISEQDLLEYDELDDLIRQARSRFTDYLPEESSRGEIASRVARLATLTFPSGVELAHMTPKDVLPKILRQGTLATRSTVYHGVKRQTQNNGSFIHMTPPGTAAEEYGDVMIGVPIDTIYKYSPRLHLEDAYQGNRFQRDNAIWSTQEVLGKFTINHPADERSTPLAFRAALVNMHREIASGVKPINIGQGVYDNLGFAASGDEDSAGKYSYPLSEIHIYTDDVHAVDTVAASLPHSDQIYQRVQGIILSDGNGGYPRHGIRYARLPNFEIGNLPLTVYAPVRYEEVPFAESTMLGNNEGLLDMMPETVDPDAYPELAGKLIDAGHDIRLILHAAASVVNRRVSFSRESLLRTYTDRREVFKRAGMGIEAVIDKIGVDGLRNILEYITPIPEELRRDRARLYNESMQEDVPVAGLTKDERKILAELIAGKLQTESPWAFASMASNLELCGYKMSGEQRALADQLLEEVRVSNERRSREDWLV